MSGYTTVDGGGDGEAHQVCDGEGTEAHGGGCDDDENGG